MDMYYHYLFTFALIVMGVLLFACLIRAIIGPKVADRIVAINMMSTLVTIMICVLALMLNEGYLVDVALIYAMIGFLAVVLLTKIYMGVYNKQKSQKGGQTK